MSTTPAPPPTKRTSTAPAPPKPLPKIHSLATIADRAALLGPHTLAIDAHTVIHPHAKLDCSAGDLTLGAHCLIAEKAAITGPAALGSGVSVASSARVEAARVGDWSTIGVGASVGAAAVVGAWCSVGARCEVRAGEVLEDFTVVYGEGQRRVDVAARDREEVREVRMKGRRMEGGLVAGLVPDAGAKWRG